MKDEFKNEKELTRQLDKYDVRIPDKLYEKPAAWSRFIQYICSPTKDPFEEISDSTAGFDFIRLFPLACAFVLAVVQAIFLI